MLFHHIGIHSKANTLSVASSLPHISGTRKVDEESSSSPKESGVAVDCWLAVSIPAVVVVVVVASTAEAEEEVAVVVDWAVLAVTVVGGRVVVLVAESEVSVLDSVALAAVEGWVVLVADDPISVVDWVAVTVVGGGWVVLVAVDVALVVGWIAVTVLLVCWGGVVVGTTIFGLIGTSLKFFCQKSSPSSACCEFSAADDPSGISGSPTCPSNRTRSSSWS